jgi:hypothetical protein
VRAEDGEPYRECIFCRKYGGGPKVIVFTSGA